MRLLALHILLLLAVQRKPYLESIDTFGYSVLYERPDRVTWHTFQRRHDDSLGVGTISFRSLPVTDGAGRARQPVVAIIYERLEDSVSVERFAELKQEASRTKWTIIRSYSPKEAAYAGALFFDGEYTFDGELHTIIVGYMVYGKIGVQVIGDSPASIFSHVDDDMRKCVQSIRFSPGK